MLLVLGRLIMVWIFSRPKRRIQLERFFHIATSHFANSIPSQAHLLPYPNRPSTFPVLRTMIGPRVTFRNTTPIAYLQHYTGPSYDFAIFWHCLYSFESPLILPAILTALLPRTKTLCMAEWVSHFSPNETKEIVSVFSIFPEILGISNAPFKIGTPTWEAYLP